MSRPELAVSLNLAAHPEGGWYRRTWTSPVTVATAHGPRPAATAILYLLDGPSRWHRVRSDELWCWHTGPTATLVDGGDGADPVESPAVRLGPPGDGDTGAAVQHLIPAGHWQRAESAGATLVTCVVSPGFDFADFELR